jgi:hypothetical protein
MLLFLRRHNAPGRHLVPSFHWHNLSRREDFRSPFVGQILCLQKKHPFSSIDRVALRILK